MRGLFLISICLGTLVSSPAKSQSLPAMDTVTVASGLSRPVFVTSPPSDYNRIFVIEQQIESPPSSNQWIGRIRVVHLDPPNTGVNATPFLTITGLAGGNEQGLLGLAFDPAYATNGKFYVHYTASNRDIVIAQYQVSAGNPDVADTTPANIKTVLRFSHPQDNHNAGWIGFSPRPNDDHNLYISAGDGGNGDDADGGVGHHEPGGNAQWNQTLLGKMLRIHIDPATGTYTNPSDNPFIGVADPVKKEIWLMGLRNPYRDSFDRLTGRMLIGDVGQSSREEIDTQQPTNPGGGENYGWRDREGFIQNPTYATTTPTPTPSPPRVDPILDYPRSGGGPIIGTTVTGGYMYRGRQIPGLHGTYLFGDYSAGKIFALNYDGSTVSNPQTITSQLFPTVDASPVNLGNPSSFGEDANGELYICDLFPGRVYKVIPTTPNVVLDDLTKANDFVLHGFGVPFKAHTVQAVASMTRPFTAQTTIGTPTAAGDGSFHLVDSNAHNFAARFYRVTYP
jgi:hypothetical protein